MSPRAACRLESLGFTEVYEYTPGKAAWLADGLQVEGEKAGEPRVGDLARVDAPTCRLDERLADVAERVRAEGWDSCVVVDGDRVVLGRLFSAQLDGDGDRSAEEAMKPGPATWRPNIPVREMVRFLDERDVSTAVVTRSDGVLVGVFRREDAGEVGHHHEHGEEGGDR